MDYREDLRKLKAEQERLDKINSVSQDLVAAFALIGIVVWWFCELEDHVDAVDVFFSDMKEASKLKKTEKERKAKIDFFERLQKDPDFRKAWEDQMAGQK